MPEVKKAELIEGEVYMPSPVRYRRHSHPHTRLVNWLSNYRRAPQELRQAITASLRGTVFPGLWLDPAALVRGDKVTVQAILQQGLSSAEHADFAARLEPQTRSRLEFRDHRFSSR